MAKKNQVEYYGILGEHKLWVKVAVAALGCYIVIHGIANGQWYYAPIGLAVILACFYSKKYVISENGVDIIGNIVGIKTHNLWTWDEITALGTDYRAAAPNAQVYIHRDVVSRMYVVTYGDSQKILKLAVEKNPDIYIDDMTPEKEAELAANARKTQARMAAEKARKREEKKMMKKRY